MSVIKYNYSGVEATQAKLDKTLSDITSLSSTIKSSKATMMDNWQAQEAVEFYNHVDIFLTLLSDFMTKYEAYTTFMKDSVAHYHTEDEILIATIQSIGAQ